MNPLLPILALGLAVVIGVSGPRVTGRPPAIRLLGLAVVAVVALGLTAKFAPPATSFGLSAGILAALAVLGIGYFLPEDSAFALGAASAAIIPALAVKDATSAAIGVVAASGFGFAALRTASGRITALTATAFAAATYLVTHRFESAAAPTATTVIGIAGVAGFLIARAGLKGKWTGELAALGALIAAVILTPRVVSEPGAGALVGAGLWGPLALGAIAAGVTRSFLADKEDAGGGGLAAIIWLGVATASFSAFRGAGMALALAGGVLVLSGTPRARPWLALGPLAGLVLYRLLREVEPSAAKSLDIGQHYALVGLVLGMVLPLLSGEYRTANEKFGGLVDTLWAILYIVVPGIVVYGLGGVGAVGFVVGAGLSGTVQSLRGRFADDGLPIGLGLGGATILASGWISDSSVATRDERLKTLGFALAGVAVVALVIALILRNSQRKVAA